MGERTYTERLTGAESDSGWQPARKQAFQSYNHMEVNSANDLKKLGRRPHTPDKNTVLADTLRPAETLKNQGPNWAKDQVRLCLDF